MISGAALKSLWDFRGFIVGSVKREYQLRYRGTMLGIAWIIIQPLMMILIYSLIFSHLMKAKLPGVNSAFAYSTFLCIGVITWGLFSEIIQRSQSVFLDNANLLKKLSFPRLTLPVIVVANAFLSFLIVFSLFFIYLIVIGAVPAFVNILSIIPLLITQVMLAVGIGMVLGVLNVFFSDVGQLSGLLLQLWFWATPVVYPASILPERIKSFMQYNPMYHLITGYQQLFIADTSPNWGGVSITAIAAIAILIYALRLFRKHSAEIVDEL